MKKTLVYLFLAMLLGTNCQRSTEELRIVQFENHLGKEKSTVLSKKVIDFEVFLTNNFSDNSVAEAYKKYLEVIATSEYKNTNWNYAGTNRKETNSQFESSGLREEIFLKPDSVWGDNESLKTKYCYNQEGVLKEFITESLVIGIDISQNTDSIIEAKYEERKFNPYGKYLIGLKMIENPNAFLTKYIQMKEAVGDISKNILADELLKSNPDFSDYLIKRIVAVEFY